VSSSHERNDRKRWRPEGAKGPEAGRFSGAKTYRKAAPDKDGAEWLWGWHPVVAALGARGVILQERHAPVLSGALAKAAAGAIDALPHARVVNLSRALERLTELGWRTVGLDGSASGTLAQTLDGRPTVLVLGSEGEGLRRLVAEHCDTLARIPMPGGFESLNVSAAAAIALYEACRPVGG
jgi:23S rRNA (guanosine2251-2'-O)-methyltransferase